LSKTNDKLAVVDKTTQLAQNEEIPEFLRSELGSQKGMEAVDQSDLLLPRLGLCQSLSPQRRKSDPAYIEGLSEGELFNTVTKEIYGEEVEIIALFFFKNRIKYFSIDSGGGIDCISPNGIDMGRISPDGCNVCKYSQWGNGAKDDEHGNDAPDCTLYHNFMAWIPSAGTPIAISYKATGLKMSKQILAGIRLTRLPMYAKKYKVTVVEMKSGNNVWFEKKIVPVGFVDSKLYKEMGSAFEALQKANVVLDTTGEAEKYGDVSFNEAGSTEL
jgi:hypothetical protein